MLLNKLNYYLYQIWKDYSLKLSLIYDIYENKFLLNIK